MKQLPLEKLEDIVKSIPSHISEVIKKNGEPTCITVCEFIVMSKFQEFF